MRIFTAIVLFSLLNSPLCLAQSPNLPRTISSSKSETQADLKELDQDTYSKLKDICDAAHHLQKTIQEIVFEVTRQDYAIASEPNVIGPIVIPAIPPPTGAIPMGIFFPPRKKYMDLYAKQTQNLFTMLAEESAALPTNVVSDSALSNKLIGIKSHLENLRKENDSLQQQMQDSSYNNLLIGKQALLMSDEIDQMKRLLKDSEKEIHSDIKQIEK